MNREYIDKNFFLLILFSFSIFFSYTSIFNLEIRFIYVVSLLHIFSEILKEKFSFSLSKLLITILLVFCIYLYSSYLYFFDFKNLTKAQSISSLLINEFNIKTLGQAIILGITILIIFFYKNLIVKNCSKLVDIFVVSFVTLILIYNIKNSNILFDTLFSCHLGFFHYTNFLFFENSHFAIVSSSIITYFFYNIKEYLNKKIIFCFHLLFFIFSIGSTTLTFYLCVISSILISLIFCRKKKSYSIYSLIILFIIVNFHLFYGKDFFNKSIFFSHSSTNIKSEYCMPDTNKIKKKIDLKSKESFRGGITSDKSKLQQLLRKDVNNLSVSIHLYSLYFAKNSITKYPLGVGLNNYSHYRKVFDNNQKIVGERPYQKIFFKNGIFNSISANALPFNKHTGSNNFSKIIVEFGLLGLLLLCFIFYMLCSRKIDNSLKILLLTLLINQLFIRGTGYFNNGFLIIIILLFSIFFDNQSKKKVKHN